MKIGIEINGVLRDTLKKIQQEYEKWFIENPFLEETDFKYEVISDVTTLDIMKHLKFKSEEELYNFLYREHTMEIFGHSGSADINSMMNLNDFYNDMREKFEIYIISDEMGKSKPATLFFLAKFGCLVENIKFYSEITINSMWDSIDILLTANPNLLLNYPKNKKVIKFNTTYNSEVETEESITSIKELKTKLENYA